MVRRYVLNLRCPDRPGIVNSVTGGLLEAGANIVESAQFSDIDTGLFAMRSVFDTDS
ncbi:MAG: ACT domain-containing protein, partial [Actinomycetota bacterium]|nr:ACT domain-containing protein [Actinomycetota bacterium]